MVKLKSNKGFTMIEMVFVLMIVQILVLCTFFHMPSADIVQIEFLAEKIKETQLKSILNYEVHEIIIHDSKLMIDHEIFDLAPLRCEYSRFHYNEKGHISAADSFSCIGNRKEVRFVLQLGSGWLRVEM